MEDAYDARSAQAKIIIHSSIRNCVYHNCLFICCWFFSLIAWISKAFFPIKQCFKMYTIAGSSIIKIPYVISIEHIWYLKLLFSLLVRMHEHHNTYCCTVVNTLYTFQALISGESKETPFHWNYSWQNCI